MPGIAGLNFAYLKGINSYHTQLDSLAYADERSLQHHGSYALSLARQFGNSNLDHAKQGNAVYFSLDFPILQQRLRKRPAD